VAGWLGRSMAGFRDVAADLVHGGVVAVHRRAGQGWQCDVGEVPCGRAWMATREGIDTSGNVAPALCTLAGLSAPAQRG
jgi:hypothetical protein